MLMMEQYLGSERRSKVRAVRTFKPVCIEAEGQTLVALMRDISTTGAGFETETGLKVGQELRYRWGDEPFRKAEVIWVDGGRFGVANHEVLAPKDLFSKRYRSVRVPITAPTSIFVDGNRIEAEAVNFSQKGVCALVSDQIRNGALATLKIGKRYFEGATAKWGENDRIGFAFSKGMPIGEMSRLLVGR